MKYVIIKTTVANIERVFPFIFSERLTHSEVAKWVLRSVEREFDHYAEVYSAGFCYVEMDSFHIAKHGSESLNIKDNVEQYPKDRKILNMPNALQDMLVHAE